VLVTQLFVVSRGGVCYEGFRSGADFQRIGCAGEGAVPPGLRAVAHSGCSISFCMTLFARVRLAEYQSKDRRAGQAARGSNLRGRGQEHHHLPGLVVCCGSRVILVRCCCVGVGDVNE
jgi:hypothetical protein